MKKKSKNNNVDNKNNEIKTIADFIKIKINNVNKQTQVGICYPKQILQFQNNYRFLPKSSLVLRYYY